MKNRSRLRRALRRCLFGSLGIILLTVGITWWTHRHLTRLTVDAINRAYPDLQLSAKTVAFTSIGELDLKAIRWRERATGKDAVFIPSARVRFSWRELRRQFIREIVVEHPRLRVTDDFIAQFKSDATAPSASESSAPWKIGKLTLNSGTARVEFRDLPSVRAGFSVHLEAGTENNQILINALRVHVPGEEADALSVEALKITASPEELRKRKLRELVLEAPDLRITDRLLALLPKNESKSSEPAWTCDRVMLIRGKVRLDLAAWPEAECGLALRAEDVAAEGGGAVELSLTSLRVRVRGEETDTFTCSSAQLAGTLAGLSRGVVQDFVIDEPRVNVTDRVLQWRPPVQTDRASADRWSPLSWKIGRLAIRRGQARVDLTGAPLAECDFGVRLQNASAAEGTELQSLEVLNVALRTRQPGVEPFLHVPAIRAEFRFAELLEQRRIARVRVEHLDFRYNSAFREMIAGGEKPAPVAKPGAATEIQSPATIGELRLSDGRVHLDGLGLGIPGIECRLETSFRELALTPGGGAGGHELQTIELSQIALRSPLDPFFTVLDLDAVFIRFTLAEIWKRQIAEVAIVRPTLAVGPDLFWYVDRVQQNQSEPESPAPAPDDGPPWTIRKFSAEAGKLLLALEGQTKLALPMPFESHAENLNFRRLADLRLKLNIEMPEQDYDYPGYELALRGVSGRIDFSLPPAKGSNNVVNTLRLRGVQWKAFRGRDLFLDVTYDEKGIYGNLSGKGYTGVVRGQFNFLLTPESDWNAWVSGTHIDLKPITDALAPEKFALTGPADFRLTVEARAKEIRNVKGDFKARSSGRMKIGKIDEFIRELPGDWSGVKRGLSRISLETIRDFAYDTAHGSFNFQGFAGAVHLDLRGPLGSRKVEMNFHDETRSAAAPRAQRPARSTREPRVAARLP